MYPTSDSLSEISPPHPTQFFQSDTFMTMSILLESDSTTPGVLLGWQRQIHLPLSPGARERNKLRQTAIPAPPLVPLDGYG